LRLSAVAGLHIDAHRLHAVPIDLDKVARDPILKIDLRINDLAAQDFFLSRGDSLNDRYLGVPRSSKLLKSSSSWAEAIVLPLNRLRLLQVRRERSWS
jgi:hypothetical protein